MDANELKTSQKSQPGVISTEKSTLLAFLHKAMGAQDMKTSSIAQHMYGVAHIRETNHPKGRRLTVQRQATPEVAVFHR